MGAAKVKLPHRGNREHSIVETVFVRSLIVYVLNSLTWAIGTLVDSVAIGNHLGVDAIAAFGLAAPMTLIYGLIGGVLSGGSRNTYTKLAGHGNTEEANSVFTLACTAAVLFSLLAVALTWILGSPLAGLLGATGQNEHLKPLLMQFLSGYVLGLPFDSVARILAGYLPMDSNHRRTITATVAMTVTDVIGDLAVVFLFDGNLFLMGLTTSIGQFVYCAVMCTHFFRKDRMLRFVFRKLGSAMKWFVTMIRNGAPAGLTRIAASAGGVLTYKIISDVAGSACIAAYSISATITSILGALYLGVADTVWMLSSIFYGEEDQRALDELQKTALRIGIALAAAVAVVFLVFARFIGALFIGYGDPETLGYTAEAIRVLAVSIPLYVVVYVFDDYLMGTGKLRSAAVYSLCLEFAVDVPVVWLMVRLMGGRGAWFATPISLCLMIIGAFVYIQCWKEGKNFSIKRLLLPRHFGDQSSRELSISATTETEVIGMARLARLFCDENGVDSKKASKFAICIEELGMNIIEHGFSDGKPHSIDIRLLVKDNELILRIRDDCRRFNLPERYALLEKIDEADPMKNAGIRMVMGMSKSVQYLSTMSTNNLIVKF